MCRIYLDNADALNSLDVDERRRREIILIVTNCFGLGEEEEA